MPTKKKKRLVPITKETKAKDVTVEQAKGNAFERVMEAYIAADRAKAEAQALVDQAKAEMQEMLNELPEDEQRSISGVKGQATLVEGSTTTIDSDYLRANLPDDAWEKITTRTLDKDKFNQALVDGVMTAGHAKRATQTKPKKPYVKVTVR